MVVKQDDPQDMDSTPLEINVREQLDKERYEIFNYNQQTPIKGDNWYLIERHWFEQWKKYVEKNSSTSSSDAINKNLHPGRIDNSSLLLHKDKARLKSDLQEHSHYELLPQAGWEMLVKLYGIVSSNHIIERQSHKAGNVEVYPIILNLKKYGEKTEPIEESFSKLTLIADVKKAAKQILEVPENKKTKLWDASQSDKMCKLDQKKTVSDCFLQSGQLVILEVADDDGNWPYTSTLPVSQDSRFRNSYLLRNGNSSSNTSYMATTPGQCGLSNLGNTCFMNSALQCLSNVPPLTNYFLSDRHHKEINRENPLGNGGKLAEEYAALIKELWSGQHTSTAPREFKYSVSQFAPRFSGYQQHDSQELMSFLVDGLHEDLNRISKKPYIEMKEAGDRPMTEVAEESWQNHRKRNDSIIVDTLHGLFRSTVDCPECPRISVTFDPFCFLSLPLPAKRERHVECLFVPLDVAEEVTKYKVTVNKFGSVHDLHQSVGLVADKSPENMSVVQIFNSKFQTFYKKTDLMKQIYEKEQLYVFETVPGKSMMPLYMRKGQSSYNPNVLGSPLLVPLSTDGPISYVLLYRTVYRAFYRHLTNTELKNKVKQFIESTSEDLEDFVPKNKEDSDENNDEKEDNAEREINLFEMFQMKTVNAYGTSHFKVFKHGDDVEVDENSYLCADWEYDLYKKYVEDQWNNKEKLHPSADPLAPKKTTKLKLQDCMKLFTTKEQLDKDDAWYCSSCKKHQQATKKFDIWMLPPVLIIHLKRFSYTRFTREKLDTYVDFPLKNLDLTDFVVNPLKKNWPRNKRNYNLIAVSNHFGGLGGGHYTAFAKNDGSWHYFDDSSVSSSNEERVVSKAAYMLVYQRQDLEEWYDDSDNKFRNFPYLQPLFSPRAFLNPTVSQCYSNGGGNNHGATSSNGDDDDEDDDVFNNNHDEAMDTTTT